MSDMDVRRIQTILEYLIEQGYLASAGEEYPVVCPSPRSGEIIFGKKPLSMMLRKEAETRTTEAARAAADPAVGGETWNLDSGLLAKLKDLRAALARRAHVPAYIVFSDASLRDMCRKRPRSADAFLEVSGVGTVKMEKYGGEFTKLIREHEEAGR
jgi:ATP-dependent DNA helicase RecQ